MNSAREAASRPEAARALNLLDTILAAEGDVLERLALKLGMTSPEARAALKRLLPAVAAGLKRTVSSPGGLETLLADLESGDHRRYLDRPESIEGDEAEQEGFAILARFLGRETAVRLAARRATAGSALSPETLERMLPLVAALAMGALARNTEALGIQGRAVAQQYPSADLMAMLGPLLEADGNGSVADELFGLSRKTL